MGMLGPNGNMNSNYEPIQKSNNNLFDTIAVPNYVAAYDPSTMNMTDYLKGIMEQNSSGYNKFRDEALRKGPSQWLNMSLSKDAMDLMNQKEKARSSAASAGAEALDRLAAQGGLSSGARERAAESGAKNFLGMSQDLTRQSNQNKLSMGIQDEQNRVSGLQNLVGQETNRVNQWGTARQNDIRNQVEEQNRLNQYNMDIYDKKMQAAAADRQARATENSGKK